MYGSAGLFVLSEVSGDPKILNCGIQFFGNCGGSERRVMHRGSGPCYKYLDIMALRSSAQ